MGHIRGWEVRAARGALEFLGDQIARVGFR